MTRFDGALDRQGRQVGLQSVLELGKLGQHERGLVVELPGYSVGLGAVQSRVRREESELYPSFAVSHEPLVSATVFGQAGRCYSLDRGLLPGPLVDRLVLALGLEPSDIMGKVSEPAQTERQTPAYGLRHSCKRLIAIASPVDWQGLSRGHGGPSEQAGLALALFFDQHIPDRLVVQRGAVII